MAPYGSTVMIPDGRSRPVRKSSNMKKVVEQSVVVKMVSNRRSGNKLSLREAQSLLEGQLVAQEDCEIFFPSSSSSPRHSFLPLIDLP